MATSANLSLNLQSFTDIGEGSVWVKKYWKGKKTTHVSAKFQIPVSTWRQIFTCIYMFNSNLILINFRTDVFVNHKCPMMANSKDGQGHKDKYLDTSRKILSLEMIMCNIKTLLLWYDYDLYYLEVMTNVNFFSNRSNVKIKRFCINRKIL